MKILCLTMSEPHDRSFGGAIRSDLIRNALLEAGEVDTVVVHQSYRMSLDRQWSDERIKRGLYSASGFGPQTWLQRAQVRRWLADIVDAGGYDVIFARYLGLANLLPPRARSRVVVDADDMIKHPTINDGWKRRITLHIRNRIAPVQMRKMAMACLVDPKLAPLLPADRQRYLPNVIPLPDRSRTKPRPERRITMVGYLDHPPNMEGALWFARNVLPRLQSKHPDLAFHLIGRCRDDLAQQLPANVVRRGFVDDITEEYDRSALVVAPIFSGAGTQIKVLDALAHERPLVTTGFAHQGFADVLKTPEHLLVADSADEWVALCTQMLENPEQATRMGTSGADIVHAGFGPARFTQTIRTIVARFAPS